MDSRLQSLLDWVEPSAQPAMGLLVPVSGGSDSALVFWLLCQKHRDKTIGVFAGGELRCASWFDSIGTVRRIPAPTEGHPETMRWAHFMSIGVAENRWLVGSRNRTEETLGNYSLSSRIATYLPLAGTWKSDVMELCTLIGVPDEVTASSRQADPSCGRPTELAEIPLELIDLFLKVKEGQLPTEQLSALTEGQTQYLERVYVSNRFKLQLPTRGPILVPAPVQQP